MNHLIKTAGFVGLGLLLGSGAAFAEKQVYRPRQTTTQWRTMVREAPVLQLHVYARKASGTDTFFNMRFGRESHTFEGRRVYLKGNGMVKASWNLNGQRPHGKELILNAYNGSVFVEKVEIVFQDGRGRTSREEHYDTGRYDSRDRYDGHGYQGVYDYREDDRYRQDEHYRYEGPPRDHGRYQPRYDAHQAHPRGCSCSQHRREEVRYPRSAWRDTPRRYDGRNDRRGW